MHLGMMECRILSSGQCDLDLVSRTTGIKSGANLLYSLRQEFQIWCVDASMDGGVSHTFFGSL